MPTLNLPLPTGPRTTAFRGFVKFIKADPVLGNVVKTWQSWEGQPKEDALPESDNMLPLVRLTPKSYPSKRAELSPVGPAMTVLDSPLIVVVEIALAGSNWADGSNLWTAIESRIFNQDPATRQANDATLKALGIFDVEELEPCLPNWDGTYQTGTGKLALDLYINT